MLGKIAEKKLRKGRRSSSSSSQSHLKDTSNISNKHKNSAENAAEDHKITEYFFVRRSKRKTAKEIEDANMKYIQHLIKTGSTEEFLEIYTCEVKGRGIRALKTFLKGEFVVEYKGEIISSKKAQIREEEYSKNEAIGSYMYYFKHRNVEYCVDSTEETPFKGRLINHSYLRPNLKTRIIDFGRSFHLVLVAIRNIEIGEELLYDYGERRPDVVAANPWLLNS